MTNIQSFEEALESIAKARQEFLVAEAALKSRLRTVRAQVDSMFPEGQRTVFFTKDPSLPHVRRHANRVWSAGGENDPVGLQFVRWLYNAVDVHCFYCGVVLTNGRGRHGKSVDHLHGLQVGNRLDNLQACCTSCNSRKGDGDYASFVALLGTKFAADDSAKQRFLQNLAEPLPVAA